MLQVQAQLGSSALEYALQSVATMQHGEVVLGSEFLGTFPKTHAVARCVEFDCHCHAHWLDARAENLGCVGDVVDGEAHDISKGMIDS